MVTDVHALAPGQMLGQYEIITPLTSGGMAAVYLGRHTGPAGFARHVAIKVVHPKFADDPQFIAMFLDEARLSSRIEHANVVRVEALGNEQGLYYMVMEYVRGTSLNLFVRKLAENKRIVLPELMVHVLAHVADGLHAAHETTDDFGAPLGIVHRDVTPQNILISYAGATKLIDFGIAKAAGRSHHTSKGAIKGKLRYMSPEQATGRAVDRRTDVFALAIIAWEMLTYKKLFSARTDAELIAMVREPQITPVRQIAPHVSDSLEAVVMQALSTSPDERFQTAQAFRRALFQACPEARSIDAQDVSTLVRATMAGEIASEQRTLPPSVVSAGDAVVIPDASREEAAMTRIVQAVTPLDEDDGTPSPVRAPGPIETPAISGAMLRRVESIAATRGPTPSKVIYASPEPGAGSDGSADPSRPGYYGGPAPAFAGQAQSGQAQSGQAQSGNQAPPTLADPRASMPQSAPRAATFTPPRPALRNEITTTPSARPEVLDPPVDRPPAATSSVGLFFGLAIAVVLTIAIGGIGGWYLLHVGRLMLTP